MGVVAKFFARAMRATAKKPPIVNPGYTPVAIIYIKLEALLTAMFAIENLKNMQA